MKTELFCIMLLAMQLVMYIGNDLIESVPLHPEWIRKPGYLGNFKRNLKAKYNELIKESLTTPEFLVINNNPAISQAYQEALKNASLYK